MSLHVRDATVEQQLIAERKRTGADRYDEVWLGEYVMSPLANNEHQLLATRLAAIFAEVLGNVDGLWSLAGANVSDQEVDWTKNFRCPDVVVVLPMSRAENRGTHWFGGPDLVVEVVSEGDASYEKFDFYGQINVREALIIDRDPWTLEMHRLDGSGRLVLAGTCSLSTSSKLTSEVLGAELSLVKRSPRPAVRVVQSSTGRIWEA